MRILVAEDDAPLADLLRQRLVQEQFAVQLASDGSEAQRLAVSQAFDLVILALNLPGAAGLDVLRSIRARKPDLPRCPRNPSIAPAKPRSRTSPNAWRSNGVSTTSP